MITFGLEIGQVIGLLVGVILPVIVGLVTTRVTSAAVKAITLAALSVVLNLLTELGEAIATGETYDLGTALVAGLGTFIVGVALHYGLWKPTGVSTAAQNTLRTAP